MATRIMVEDMVESFCGLFGKNMTPTVLDAWMKALGRYRDPEISKAGHRAMEECQRMPTPLDVISRISPGDQKENEKFVITSARCSRCSRFALCISEPTGSPYLCRECYTGLTNDQIAERFRKLGEMIA